VVLFYAVAVAAASAGLQRQIRLLASEGCCPYPIAGKLVSAAKLPSSAKRFHPRSSRCPRRGHASLHAYSFPDLPVTPTTSSPPPRLS
jgi:hypothetical protein